MQVKATSIFPLTLLRRVPTKKACDNKQWLEYRPKKLLYTADGNVNHQSHYSNQCRDSSKTDLPGDPGICPLDTSPAQHATEKSTMFTVALFITLGYESSLGVHQQRNGLKKVVHT